jgi:hypothetical protein
VKNSDHAGLAAEVLWVSGDEADRLGGRPEQDVIDDALFCSAMAAIAAGTVKTTWKYGTGRRSACRSATDSASAKP